MKTEIPDFILEMSQQMVEQPNRCTSHPFWQVRCKRLIVTEEGYNESCWCLCDDDGEFYRSDSDECVNEVLLERYPEFCKKWGKNEDLEFLINFEIDTDYNDLPSIIRKVYLQETEEIISTHLTQHDAEWFIKRKQHDYQKLYTYVESAYWSPQLKQLQDWIISLSKPVSTKVA